MVLIARVFNTHSSFFLGIHYRKKKMNLRTNDLLYYSRNGQSRESQLGLYGLIFYFFF